MSSSVFVRDVFPSAPGQVRGSCAELLRAEGPSMHTGKSEVRIHSKCAALLGMLGHHHGFADFADLTDLCWKQDERVECAQDADLLRPKAAQEKAHPNKSLVSGFCMAPGQGQGRAVYFTHETLTHEDNMTGIIPCCCDAILLDVYICEMGFKLDLKEHKKTPTLSF